MPNYFGAQRFGRDAANLQRLAAPRRLAPRERGFVLSAARSVIFNALLAVRVTDGSWEQLRAGDVANLDGRGSVFRVDAIDAALHERCRRLAIHATGPLWGEGCPASDGEVRELETAIAARYPEAAAACAARAWLRSAAACASPCTNCVARSKHGPSDSAFASRAGASRPQCLPS